MANPAPTSLPPVTEEAFFKDRMAMWHGFTGATKGGIVAVVLLLVGMAVFLL